MPAQSLGEKARAIARVTDVAISTQGVALLFIGVIDGKNLAVELNRVLFPRLTEEELVQVAQDIAARVKKADDINNQRAAENAKNSETIHGYGA